jgi:hypothetical protein
VYNYLKTRKQVIVIMTALSKDLSSKTRKTPSQANLHN